MVKTSIDTIQTQLRTMKPPDPDKKRSSYVKKHQKLTNELHQLLKIKQQQEENLDQVLLQWNQKGSMKEIITDSTSGSEDSHDYFGTNDNTYQGPRRDDSSSEKGSMGSQHTTEIMDDARTTEETWTSAITRKHHRREMENITKLNKHVDILFEAAREVEQTGHLPRRYEDLINEGRCLTCDISHDQCPWGHKMDIISLQHLHKLITTTYQQAKKERVDAKEAIILVTEMYWKYAMTMNQIIGGRKPFHHRSFQPRRMTEIQERLREQLQRTSRKGGEIDRMDKIIHEMKPFEEEDILGTVAIEDEDMEERGEFMQEQRLVGAVTEDIMRFTDAHRREVKGSRTGGHQRQSYDDILERCDRCMWATHETRYCQPVHERKLDKELSWRIEVREIWRQAGEHERTAMTDETKDPYHCILRRTIKQAWAAIWRNMHAGWKGTTDTLEILEQWIKLISRMHEQSSYVQETRELRRMMKIDEKGEQLAIRISTDTKSRDAQRARIIRANHEEDFKMATHQLWLISTIPYQQKHLSKDLREDIEKSKRDIVPRQTWAYTHPIPGPRENAETTRHLHRLQNIITDLEALCHNQTNSRSIERTLLRWIREQTTWTTINKEKSGKTITIFGEQRRKMTEEEKHEQQNNEDDTTSEAHIILWNEKYYEGNMDRTQIWTCAVTGRTIYCDTQGTQEEKYADLASLEDASLEHLLKHPYREMTPGDEIITDS